MIPPLQKPPRSWVVLGVVSLLAVLVLQLALAARRESQTWDEACHIFDGYNHWKHSDSGMNPEHPPLVKLLSTLPLLRLPLRMPQALDLNFKEAAFLEGHDFLYSNNADLILFRVRMAAAILTVLLALLVFAAACEMFGPGPAFLALALFVFEPSILAHGAVLATDMGITCLLFAAVYAFYRYVKKPSLWRLLVVALAVGLALAAKHSGIFLFPILILLAAYEVLRRLSDKLPQPPSGGVKHALRLAAALVVVGLLAVGILWSFYGFRYAARPAGLTMNPPLSAYVGRLSSPIERTAILTLARWRVFPEAYLYGLADVKAVADETHSYLFGKIYPEGQLLYFPVVLVSKTTLALLLFLLLLPFAVALLRSSRARELVFLTMPPALYFIVAVFSRLNIGVRHILPIYPFLCVLAGFAAWTIASRKRAWAFAVAAVILFGVVSSLRCFPTYLAYSNELWGGPPNTHKFLTDSNADWGQQLHSIKRYVDKRGIKQCWFAYFADVVADPAYYGIPCKPLTTISSFWLMPPREVPARVAGTVLISAGTLSGYEFGPGELNPYEQFKALKPVATIEYGVFVYEGHFEIPLAAAINHLTQARRLTGEGQLDQALAEAQTSAALAPNSAMAQAALGEMLMRMKRPDEAHQAFQRALTLAQKVEPEFQRGWMAHLQNAVNRK